MIPMHKFEFIYLGNLFDVESTYEFNKNAEYATV